MGDLVKRLLLLLKPLFHKGINALGATVLDRSEYQPHDDTWPDLHRLKTSHLRDHSSSRAPYRTRACLHVSITLHVYCFAPNHMLYKLETVIANARLHKGELASPSRYTSLYTTLLTHYLSVSVLT
jgi:hypothetical protein